MRSAKAVLSRRRSSAVSIAVRFFSGAASYVLAVIVSLPADLTIVKFGKAINSLRSASND